MLRLLCVFALAVVLQAQTGRPAATGDAAKPGAIRGAVLAVTGEPLRKAEVMLRSVGGQRGGAGGPGRMGPGMPMSPGDMPGMWAHTTDASGAFAFEQLPPGTYALTVQRTGYVRAEYGSRGGQRSGSTITVGPGQEVGGITVKLTPHGVITGKVTDEEGDPIAHTSVQVMRERWMQGKRQMVPMNADSTNDLGEYRIAGLLPGMYHLMVNYNRPDPFSRPRPAGAESDLSYVSVYYPGTFDAQQAALVRLAPGQELRGIDFQLRKVATYRVRGKVLDETGASAQQVAVMAMPEGGVFFGGPRGMGMVRNGSFEIGGLQPGTYTLMANSAGRGQARSFARQTVQVGARDVDGVVLAMQPTFEVTGTVKAPEGVALAGARVFLDSMESGNPFGGGGSGPVGDGNAWKMENIAPGRYRFFLNPLPEGTYVKGVSVQGQDITSGAMISAAAAGIEVALGTGAPEVTGTVANKDKEPAGGAAVVLVPDGRQEQFWLYRTATADQNGSFAVKNIAPGNYTAYAFLDVEDGAWYSAEFLKQHGASGVRLRLEEKGRESAALTAVQP